MTKSLINKIDFEVLYVNALAGGEPEHAKLPLTSENDREAVAAAVESVGLIPPESLKIIRIRNTARLDVVVVSETFSDAVKKRPDLKVLESPRARASTPPETFSRFPANLHRAFR